MATEQVVFRKPNGPVAQVHKFLDSKFDQIKRGTVSRKELLDKLVDKGISIGTATTQCYLWSVDNGISFARPAQAADAKKAAKKKPAKKAPAKKKPATKKKAAA